MNREDIISMARQTGSLIELAQEKDLLWLENFAYLVAKQEREACAKLCEDKAERYVERAAKPENERDINPDTARIAQQTCFHLADNIRARSKE